MELVLSDLVRHPAERARDKNPLITDNRPPTGDNAWSFSVVEQAKIQAQVLVPLVNALQAEVTKERATVVERNGALWAPPCGEETAHGASES